MADKPKTVKDYMIPLADYPTLPGNATLEQAVNMMYRMSREKGYRWIVVLDQNNKIAGFLTLRGVFEAINNLAPKAGGWLGVFTFNRPGMFYWEGVQMIKDTPLKKCIKPVVQVSVAEDDYPSKAAEIILNRRITIVPVVNEQGEVVGIVRPVDLLPFIKQLFDNAPPS